ncbi:MAG TPA: peptide chain release factor 2 [Candidatus Methylomirabilis sp.]|nr:peptide chain release factor 2 [Candidatus Methylomirabilis sp.]
MEDLNPLFQKLRDLQDRSQAIRGYLDFDSKSQRLVEVQRELEQPDIWNNPQRAQELGKERARLESEIGTLAHLATELTHSRELLELAREAGDAEVVASVAADLAKLEKQLADLEFQRMFSGEMDANNAFMDIQAGSGGTEAQDWANMLLRMYLMWGDRRGFKTEILGISEGEVAGIKSATVRFTGPYAFGYLRTETGVHRLVRKSPFDSGNRRHTSFASVFAYPEVDEDIEVDINPADLRVDTYRASGAGGQHVNRTDSAVRITHNPSGIVVQCQSDRSQHRNRAEAMKMLKARLYELEREKLDREKQKMEASKTDIEWGHQIRSYVLDQSRVKDLRTGVESGNPQAVLDGDLDKFIDASLKSGLKQI